MQVFRVLSNRVSRRLNIRHLSLFAVGSLAAPFVFSQPAIALSMTQTIHGSDAIFLSGRDDVLIPDASEDWDVLGRHSYAIPENIQETKPDAIGVAGGDIIRILDLARGGISFYNGFGDASGPVYGPDGSGTYTGADIHGLGGISGYKGPLGALVGVFLDDNNPNDASNRPDTLDFSGAGAIEFSQLSPALSQVFYIGNGADSHGALQQFLAPTGATRLFLGIADGFNFLGAPGAYDDNDGAYHIRVGINEVPADVPTPALLPGLIGMGVAALRKRQAKETT